MSHLREVGYHAGCAVNHSVSGVLHALPPARRVDVDVRCQVEATRHGRPVPALSRTHPDTVQRLCDWILRLRETHLGGAHTPADPGPMAPHSHQHDRTA